MQYYAIGHKEKCVESFLKETYFNEYQDEIVLLSQIPMIISDSPISFKSVQFSIQFVFEITINKSQSQTMSIYQLDLEKTCFSYGQLYG